MLAIYTSVAFSTASGLALAPSASIEVRRTDTGALASIFSDEAGTAAKANPFSAASDGSFSFYAAGIARGYQVKSTYNAEVVILANQAIGTAAQYDAAAFVPAIPAGTGASVYATPDESGVPAWVHLGAGTIRQSILAAALDASGYNAALTVGSGLRPGLDASPTSMVLAFASGFGPLGAQDLMTTLSADASDIIGADLKASNTSYVYASYTNSQAVSWARTLVPPDYGYAFDRTRGALLNFEGTNGATTTTDDFGNTWTLSSATISTAQFKFGASSLDCTGGTAKSAASSDFVEIGDGSWEISLWFRINALPGSGADGVLFAGDNGSFFNIYTALSNTAGTVKFRLALSANGSSFDITDTQGANTTWTLNQWNKARIVFDALAGTYRVYLSLNGAAETQDITVSSTARVTKSSRYALGRNLPSATSQFNGWFDAFRVVRCATVTGTETPAAAAPAIGDLPYHHFSIPEMKMYEVTGASSSAGTNPTLTQRSRIFAGECDTNGSAVSAVRNYALRGRHQSAWVSPIPATSTTININTNLGTKEAKTRMQLKCVSAAAGYSVGEIIDDKIQGGSGTDPVQLNPSLARNTATFHTSATNGVCVIDKSAGTLSSIGSSASFAYRMVTERTF
jgi:hypothetical protein